MRIAVWHNLPSGGGKRALYDHVRGLVGRGHAVEVWCPPTANREYLPLGDMVPEHVVDLKWPVRFRRSDEWQLTLETAASIAAMDAHCRQCASEIDRAGFDIVFANSCQFFRTTSIGRFAATPAVLYLQEPFRWLYEALPRLWWLAPPHGAGSKSRVATLRAAFVDIRRLRNRRLQGREEVDNAAAFSRILVNSYFSRESVLRAYGLDSDVCYLGIDTTRFTDLGLPRDGYIIGLGSITLEKNVQLCIEAVGLLAPPRPKLVWVGNIADTEYLTGMRALAAARDVAFEPLVNISDDKLLDVLNRAMVMVYAPRLEPFGLAPLEANASATPVIAVAEGGVRETVVDQVTGLLVAHSPNAMATAIDVIRKDTGFARRLGSNARQNVETKWDFVSATDRIEQNLALYARIPRA